MASHAMSAHLTRVGNMDEETLETNFYFLHRDAHARERAKFVAAP